MRTFELNPFTGKGLIGKVQRSLFAPLYKALQPDPKRIKIGAAPSRYDEVEEAARRISELLEKGVPPEKIGLTMRSIGPYDQFIRDVFERQKIPYFYRRLRGC